MAERKLIDEVHRIADRRGNGQLRREAWVDDKGHVTHYNLTYVNHDLHSGDNGRVVGYDNQHGYHHRHYMGKVSKIDFAGFEDVEARFESDWLALRRKP